ncbi:MAG: hypothetical protein ACJAX5_001182 [Patiriisocius sp.]|jgi:hypothetical protein
MPKAFVLFSLLLSWFPPVSAAPIAIVIHGGAGTILKENITSEVEAAY